MVIPAHIAQMRSSAYHEHAMHEQQLQRNQRFHDRVARDMEQQSRSFRAFDILPLILAPIILGFVLVIFLTVFGKAGFSFF